MQVIIEFIQESETPVQVLARVLITVLPSVFAIAISVIALIKTGRQNKTVSTTDIIKTILDAKTVFNKYMIEADESLESISADKGKIYSNIKLEFENYINNVELGCLYYLEGIINRDSFRGLIFDILKNIITDDNYKKLYNIDSYQYLSKVWDKWE